MANDLLSEVEKERATPQREKDQLRSNLEKPARGRPRSWSNDQGKQQGAIDLCKRMKYKQRNEDHEWGKLCGEGFGER